MGSRNSSSSVGSRRDVRPIRGPHANTQEWDRGGQKGKGKAIYFYRKLQLRIMQDQRSIPDVERNSQRLFL